MRYDLPRIPLTPSQKQSIIALAVVGVSAGYDALSKLSTNPLFHPSPIIAALLPLALILAGAIKAALNRSLDKSRSGTGGGIFGSAPDKAAEATQGGTMPMPSATTPAPSATTPALDNLGSVLALLLTNASALSAPRQLALLASAGTHLTEQSGEAAKTLMDAKQLDQAALLAGISRKADAIEQAGTAEKADTAQKNDTVQKVNPPAETQPGIAPSIFGSAAKESASSTKESEPSEQSPLSEQSGGSPA